MIYYFYTFTIYIMDELENLENIDIKKLFRNLLIVVIVFVIWFVLWKWNNNQLEIENIKNTNNELNQQLSWCKIDMEAVIKWDQNYLYLQENIQQLRNKYPSRFGTWKVLFDK